MCPDRGTAESIRESLLRGDGGELLDFHIFILSYFTFRISHFTFDIFTLSHLEE